VSNKYVLEKDGDHVEQVSWSLFLRKDFPLYEKFWQDKVAPTTNRPSNNGFKTNEELSKIGLGEKDILYAELHYTILSHLLRVFELKNSHNLTDDQFIEALVRLCAAIDLAEELLGRICSDRDYELWSARAGIDARRAWRSQHGNDDLELVRNYRNRVLHGAVVPKVKINSPNSVHTRIPKLDKIDEYLDWRKVMVLNRSSDDIISPEELLSDAWKVILSYINDNWSHIT